MATSSITRKFLSLSTNGKGVLVQGIATSSSVPIHVVSANKDELHLWAQNSHATSDITVTIELAGTTDPKDTFKLVVPALSSRKVINGITLGSSTGTINAFASTGSYISIFGHVNEIA